MLARDTGRVPSSTLVYYISKQEEEKRQVVIATGGNPSICDLGSFGLSYKHCSPIIVEPVSRPIKNSHASDISYKTDMTLG